MWVHAYACMCVWVWVHALVCVCVYASMCVHTRVYMCPCVVAHAHVCSYINKYKYIFILNNQNLSFETKYTKANSYCNGSKQFECFCALTFNSALTFNIYV